MIVTMGDMELNGIIFTKIERSISSINSVVNTSKTF